MTTIFFKKIEGNRKVVIQPAKNQDFFTDFNWNNCQAGDIIWLEDYTDNDARPTICGIITMFNFNNPIIRLLPNVTGRYLAKYDIQTVDDIKKISRSAFRSVHNYMYE
jgi:hypothetical protein